MSKIIFIVYRNPECSHEECIREWKGNRHKAVVSKIKGLEKWVLNEVLSENHSDLPDGIGELQFADALSLKQAMHSEQMKVAAEDAATFFDMQKSYTLLVKEYVALGG